MSLSDRGRNWILEFLQTSHQHQQHQHQNQHVMTKDNLSRLRSNFNIASLKVWELKSISSELSLIMYSPPSSSLPSFFTHLQQKPSSLAAHKQDWINYVLNVFRALDAQPRYWDFFFAAMRTRIQKLMQPNNNINSLRLASTANVAANVAAATSNYTNMGMNTSHCHYKQEHPSNTNVNINIHTNSNLDEIIQNDFRIQGKDYINMIKYEQGIPILILNQLHSKFQYKGYPSKLRHEQVRIKTEKQQEARMQNHNKHYHHQQHHTIIQNNQGDYYRPQTTVEFAIVTALQQMGFQDVQEIMISLRHVMQQQQQQQHQLAMNTVPNTHMLVDSIMIHIINQREEKEEAKKMDEARIQSENDVLIDEQRRRQRQLEQREKNNQQYDGNLQFLFHDNDGGDNRNNACSSDGNGAIFCTHGDIIDFIGSLESSTTATPTIKSSTATTSTTNTTTGNLSTKSIHFPHSHLLSSIKVRTIFHSILVAQHCQSQSRSSSQPHKNDTIRVAKAEMVTIKNLLSLEQKANKWYGDVTPKPFFGHVLCKRIESWYSNSNRNSRSNHKMDNDNLNTTKNYIVIEEDEDIDNADNMDVDINVNVNVDEQSNNNILMKKMEDEVKAIENAMYNLSEQDVRLQVPKLFIEAREVAIEHGWIDQPKDDVIIIDDDDEF